MSVIETLFSFKEKQPCHENYLLYILFTGKLTSSEQSFVF